MRIKAQHVHVHREPGVERVLAEIVTALTALKTQGSQLMSALSDSVGRQEVALARLAAGVINLSGDIEKLNTMIADLQNSPDRVTAADQARLDAIVEQSESVAAQLEALDALTPADAPPPVEPPAEDPPVVEEPVA